MRPPVPLVLACFSLLMLAGCAGKGPSAGEQAGHDDDSVFSSRTYVLNALLAPPVTRYNVTSTGSPLIQTSYEVNSSSMTYTWSNSNKCGRFTSDRGFAVWEHGDDTDCPHDSPSHPGMVKVILGNLSESTASTGYATCEWEGGSNTGTSPACFVSSVAPEGQPKARGTSIPWSLPATIAGAALAAIALGSRRAR